MARGSLGAINVYIGRGQLTMVFRRKFSRRAVVTGAAAAAATGATVALAEGAAAQAAPKSSPGGARIARVVSHVGDSAQVEVLSAAGAVVATTTAPVSGFPAGWRLRAGDRVVLAPDDTVNPLVKPVRGRLEGSGRSSARIGGRKVSVSEDIAAASSAAVEENVAFCVDNDSGESLSVMGLKPVSSFAVVPQNS
ncbi:hypothetical protein QLQ12_32645 [Actinoplanes sp. NEAU-A12]|uniref:Secreted protein n=1 Tax=Actinoplanes sandaracinus TaxID=3045177 RepID=A0ABT6WUJ8_9ACTN|nr:hypothetical protein [Actinoplanes sandaracinus]MDI6103369.1 hypothetical protein [Actinoplanes sandaracinus]